MYYVILMLLFLMIFIVIFGRDLGRSQEDETLYPFMMGLATGVPKYKVTQADALKIALKAFGTSANKDYIEQIYSNACISTRYMSVPDFSPPNEKDPKDEYFHNKATDFTQPVQERLVRFKKEAIPLVTDVCKRAIANAGVSVNDIHKLVVVSSTGFLGPSLDCELINSLGLPRSTDRTLVGFMGCAAAMNGYRVAMDFVKANPGKLALMVCVEISSVHSTFNYSVNNTIIHAIFADGCAACVLTAKPRAEVPPGTLCIVEEHGLLMPGTDDGIQLAINHDGITCTLSKDLPKYIALHIGTFVDALLRKQNFTRTDVDFWAIHPGGRRIIEQSQLGLKLTPAQASDSWAVLNQYGNMLSPSVMFVLEKVLARHKAARARGEDGMKVGVAFSFSPGVGAEGIMLAQI